MKMKRLLSCLLMVISLSLISCAGISTGPRSMEESFPLRNQDPRVGLIINQGSVHLNLFIYDGAGRLMEEIYIAGAKRYLTINGQNIPQYWGRRLEVGQYHVEIYPFYYRTNIINPIFGRPARFRVDLPRQVASIYVDRNPSNYYYGGRHWGWILYLNSGNIPDNAQGPGIPGIQMNFQGEAWKIFGD